MLALAREAAVDHFERFRRRGLRLVEGDVAGGDARAVLFERAVHGCVHCGGRARCLRRYNRQAEGALDVDELFSSYPT